MHIFEQLKNLKQSGHETGQVAIDAAACNGCGQCVNICPASALLLRDTADKQKFSYMAAGMECISCAACVAVCEPGAILISRFWRVPEGAYRTEGKFQPVDDRSWPRIFGDGGKDEDSPPIRQVTVKKTTTMQKKKKKSKEKEKTTKRAVRKKKPSKAKKKTVRKKKR